MASIWSLLIRHYIHYLHQPAVLLTLLIILCSGLFVFFESRTSTSLPRKADSIPGCYRLCLSGQSRLDEKPTRQSKRNSSIGGGNLIGAAYIKALFTYPIKSCGGVELKASEVHATGLKYDRLFTFAQRITSTRPGDDPEPKTGWRFLTQRECPRLAQVKTQLWVPDPRQTGAQKRAERGPQEAARLDGGLLVVTFPSPSNMNILGIGTQRLVTLRTPLQPAAAHAEAKRYTTERLTIWKDRPLATNVTSEIDESSLAKLRRFLGVRNPLALFRVDNDHLREITRSLPQDRPKEKFYVGFADAFPVNLLNLASVRAVDEMLPAGSAIKGDLDARRFRANIYIAGPPAYAEESWKKLSIGRCIQLRDRAHRHHSPLPRSVTHGDYVEADAEYYVACRTARCRMPNVHPETGERDRHEPDQTLRDNRDVDEGASPHPVLGMQMIPFFSQGVLRVGDQIEVLERGEHHYEKMFG